MKTQDLFLRRRIEEYQKRERELNEQIERLQGRVASQEDKTLAVRDQSREKHRKLVQDHGLLQQEIRELKLQVKYFRDQSESYKLEQGTLRKDLARL